MGQIRQQAAKNTAINFLATAVSAIASITIYAQELELYGLLGFLMDTALLFTPFIMLSGSSSVQKFFPVFAGNLNGERAMFSLGLSLIGIGFLLLLPVLILFKGFVIPQMPNYADGNMAESYFYLILPIALSYAFISFSASFCAIYNKAAVPAIFQVGNKFFTPFVVILFALDLVSMQQAVYVLIGFYLLSVLGITLYTVQLGQLKWVNPLLVFEKIDYKQFSSFSFFSLLSLFGRQLTTRIDSFMVPLLFTVGLNGEYRIAAFMAGVLLVPYRSIASLMSPMIANAWQHDNLQDIAKMYRDSSVHSLMVGVFLFLLIFYNIDELLQLMPRGAELVNLRLVFIVIAASKLIDLAAGVNDQIIAFSKYYRFNFYLLFFLGLSNVVFNLIFAEWYGFIGIAWATALSLAFFNAAKMLFIYMKFQLQPFSASSLRLAFLTSIVVFSMYFFPEMANPWISGIATSLWITLLFVSLAFVFKISSSWNALLLERLKRLF